MKAILLQDIENLGKKWDVKKVASGYARNYLIPRGLIRIATPKAMKDLEKQKEFEAKKAEEELKIVQGQASMVDGMEVTIPIKTGEEGKIFGSVTSQIIAEKLQELGFKDVKKSQIVLKKPIKELGEFPVVVKFEHNLEVEINVIVAEEKE